MNRKQANLGVIVMLWVALVRVIGIKCDWLLAARSAAALAMFLLQVVVLFYGSIAIISGRLRRAWPLLMGAAISVSYCLLLAYIGAHRELLTHVVLSVAVSIGLLVFVRRGERR